MTTAMDEAFKGGDDEEFASDHEHHVAGNSPAEVKKSKFDAKFLGLAAVAAAVIGFGGTQIYKRFSPPATLAANPFDGASRTIAPAIDTTMPAAAPVIPPMTQAATIPAAIAPPTMLPTAAASATSGSGSLTTAPMPPANSVAPVSQYPVARTLNGIAPDAAVLTGSHNPAAALASTHAPAVADQAAITKLTAELEASHAEVLRLGESIQVLQAKVAEGPKAATHIAPRVAIAKVKVERKARVFAKAGVNAETKSDTADGAIEAKTADVKSVGKKSITRTDFRIYAMRDGQVWVQDNATKDTSPTAVGAMLPDGSRVLAVDEHNGLIATSGGDIRYAVIAR